VKDASADVVAALGGSFQLLSWADVWYAGLPLAQALPVTSGQIDFDLDRDIEARLDIVIGDQHGMLAPLYADDPLSSFGQEIHVTQAITSAGLPLAEPISVGWYRIDASKSFQKWRRTSKGTWHASARIEIIGNDRMSILADARFLSPSQPASGATVFSEISRLIEGLVPLGGVDETLVDIAVPTSIVYEQDRVKALVELADSIGAVLTVDADGQLEVRVPTIPTDTPVWTFTVGDGGDIVDYDIEMTRDSVVNAVVATGEATGSDYAPVVGRAFDLDPMSPTYWGGPFGQVPMFFSSPLLTTAAAAGAAAATRLNTIRRGRDRVYTFQTVPNFLIELDDPVQVVLPDRSVVGRVVKMTLPLTPAAMTISVRALDSSVTIVNP
jgi:hypothetical protein